MRVTQAPAYAPPWFDVADDSLIVASPAHYLAPVALTDIELLEQALALLLLRIVLAQASEQYAIRESWQPMRSGLRLWQLWELELPLALWRKEIVQWVYHDLPLASSGQPLVLPDHYAEFCAAHRLWTPSPIYLDVPLVCVGPEADEWLWAQRSPREPLIHLAQFSLSVSVEEDAVVADGMGQANHRGQTVALATLIEYAVATYGRKRLPALVAGLGQYESWATLIPAVYGVSPAEFEAGWQAYLATHYGVSLETLLHQ